MKGVAFTEKLARESSIHAALRPALGGIVVGLMAMARRKFFLPVTACFT
ncbi:hypothetical protein ABID21_004176 [Pseudorhizobium tarimense]|uniref:Uncharacterized protein n=1 Tax=Pseudorhizobium tarimense TaxID=1079109 RepID=A0ABV2HBZ0_9HYPH